MFSKITVWLMTHSFIMNSISFIIFLAFIVLAVIAIRNRRLDRKTRGYFGTLFIIMGICNLLFVFKDTLFTRVIYPEVDLAVVLVCVVLLGIGMFRMHKRHEYI